jgi:hypothetical protein
MKKFYQTEWQGIQFSDFAKLSSRNPAGPEFYQAFYKEFFKRYKSWAQLSLSWRKEKESCAEMILDLAGAYSRTLSVGCGLGYMEHWIHAQAPQHDLFIHEVAPSAWQWVGIEFTEEHKLLGLIPNGLPKDILFNLVYLSAVDYTLDDDALVGLLSAIRPFLLDGGQCLLISASFQDTPATITDIAMSVLRRIKALTAAPLECLGLRHRGQFWGWTRTQKEYYSLMRCAGYRDIKDGFVDSENRAHYWISGR